MSNSDTSQSQTAALYFAFDFLRQRLPHRIPPEAWYIANYFLEKFQEMPKDKAEIEWKCGRDAIIPLKPTAREVLENHSRTDSPYVFPRRGGQQRTDIKKQVNRIKEAARFPNDFRPLHGLRHVYASLLASSGQVDLYTLQKLLTHKSAAMTQRYAHLRDEALKQVANLAGELVSQIANIRNHPDLAQEA